jgi:hypothetical protein
MTGPEAVGTYHDADGAMHQLLVRETADGGWQVLDLDAGANRARVVDTLDGDQDGRPQAEAIARDYLTTFEGFRASVRREAGEPISEEGGSDAHRHRRPRRGLRQPQARRAALPRSAS